MHTFIIIIRGKVVQLGTIKLLCLTILIFIKNVTKTFHHCFHDLLLDFLYIHFACEHLELCRDGRFHFLIRGLLQQELRANEVVSSGLEILLLISARGGLLRHANNGHTRQVPQLCDGVALLHQHSQQLRGRLPLLQLEQLLRQLTTRRELGNRLLLLDCVQNQLEGKE